LSDTKCEIAEAGDDGKELIVKVQGAISIKVVMLIAVVLIMLTAASALYILRRVKGILLK